MSFGYSVGDFLGGANLTYRLIRALSDSRGASAEYQEAVTELRATEQAFMQAGNLARSNMFTQDVMNGIACIVLSSVEIIESFFEHTRALQSRLGQGRRSINSSWSKIGWQLFGRDELLVLKRQLHERLTSVNTLIAAASYQINTPSNTGADGHESDQIGPSYSAPGPSERQKGRPLTPEVTPVIDLERAASTNEVEVKSREDLEQELRSKINAENAAATAAAQATAVDTDIKENMMIIKQMMTALNEKEVRKELDATKAKAPLRFKDAVGRKYSFPWHICHVWKDTREHKASSPFKDGVPSGLNQYIEPSAQPSQFQTQQRSLPQGTDLPAFWKLDQFEPNWRSKYSALIAQNGLTDGFIRENQEGIMKFLLEWNAVAEPRDDQSDTTGSHTYANSDASGV
ncbi:Uu.00g125070.m01.CDS01 [Anthostomella pinea]|uniref:Uu.00g125070.m01.CDS01 n=1 Tax=Anthostomella pinea TaxID=933095 RepID=A0AAI8YF89_9PEZI|nr:Uu.00g125070.m01.CDS01 [Anthostomella pinea]